jgi:hypothetical protein
VLARWFAPTRDILKSTREMSHGVGGISSVGICAAGVSLQICAIGSRAHSILERHRLEHPRIAKTKALQMVSERKRSLQTVPNSNVFTPVFFYLRSFGFVDSPCLRNELPEGHHRAICH